MNELKALVLKDFEVNTAQNEEELRATLVKAFAYLLDHDFNLLLTILYRTDVDEEKLKKLLVDHANLPSADVIADAYLERQKQKVYWRKKYGK